MIAAASSSLAALPKKFVKSGWTHKQIERKGNAAIYKRWRDDKQGFARGQHYEVVLIREQRARAFGHHQVVVGIRDVDIAGWCVSIELREPFADNPL